MYKNIYYNKKETQKYVSFIFFEKILKNMLTIVCGGGNINKPFAVEAKISKKESSNWPSKW